MTENSSQQYADLAQRYATYSNTELNDLALTLSDLTAPAQQALKAEFGRRNLPLPSANPAQPVAAPEPDAPEYVFEFNDFDEAYVAQSILRSAGIESEIPNSEIIAVDTPRLIVGPDDYNAAQLILSQAPTAASDEVGFSGPPCPNCGVPDPVLESVEPTNQWRCEACNHIWSDPA
jgi:hypothetical protein